MKVPNNIKYLYELVEWIKKKSPKTIEISKKSELLETIEEFGRKRCRWFRGIRIIYKRKR